MERDKTSGRMFASPNSRHMARPDSDARDPRSGVGARGGLALVLALALGSLASGDAAAAKSYRNIEVKQFDVSAGVAFPQEHMAALMGDVRVHLAKLGRFDQVLGDRDQPADPDAPTIQLTGTVVKYSKGSRFMRYMIGPASLAGPGKTKVVVELEYRDRDTGETLYMAKVDGKVWIDAPLSATCSGELQRPLAAKKENLNAE